MHGPSGRHALGDMAQRRQNRGECFAAPQAESDPPVSREVAGAGQHQIAEAGKSGQRLAPASQRDRKPGCLGQTARDQRGARIIAEAQPVAQNRPRSTGRGGSAN